MRHFKKKTNKKIATHFQRRSSSRLGAILNQQILKNLQNKNKIKAVKRQSLSKTIFLMSKEVCKQTFNIDVPDNVVLVYDRVRHGFVTTWIDKNHRFERNNSFLNFPY